MIFREQVTEQFFHRVSYAVAVLAMLALFTSGCVGATATLLFLFVTVLAWNIEGTKWQISDRSGVILIFLIILLFYADWKFQISGFGSRDAFAVGNLCRLILVLSIIKLLQKKSDRDWAFIYIISFFKALLAAGVGISPLFLLFLIIYLLVSFFAIILFEVRKSSTSVFYKTEKKTTKHSLDKCRTEHVTRIPLISGIILISISLTAIPLFFLFPRVGGAGLGSNVGGSSGFIGFSDSVKIGEIGRLLQSDEVVMRIRLDDHGEEVNNLRWQGVVLDNFDGQTWRKTRYSPVESLTRTGDFFLLEKSNNVNRLVTQTIYLEPLDTSALFALPRPVALQGNFETLNRDSDGALSLVRRGSGRINYKVYSDNKLLNDKNLNSDNAFNPESVSRYLQLPKQLDERISRLTKEIIHKSGATTRFEQAKAVESYLQKNFGYTLDLKAGGEDPLADFLFNVREGHCEYFASALAIMLRTQGIATRVVNGFNGGDYNETADIFVVRQRNAHSWVEVYFPKTQTWVIFDATPSAGQTVAFETNGLTARLNTALEALEAYWIQYFVSFDNNEQRSLFVWLRKWLSSLQNKLADWVELAKITISQWWQKAKGDEGLQASLYAISSVIGSLIALALGMVALIRFWRRIKKIDILRWISLIFQRKNEAGVVEFYERMQKVLAKKGLIRQPHQTPLEFALALNMSQVVTVTEKYHDVRYGKRSLSRNETAAIENWLKELEEKNFQE